MVILKQWQICYQAVSGQLDLIPGHKLCLPRTRASCKSCKAAVGNDFSASFHRLGSPGTASDFWWWPSWPWKICHGRFWTQFASSLAEVCTSCYCPVSQCIEILNLFFETGYVCLIFCLSILSIIAIFGKKGSTSVHRLTERYSLIFKKKKFKAFRFLRILVQFPLGNHVGFSLVEDSLLNL